MNQTEKDIENKNEHEMGLKLESLFQSSALSISLPSAEIFHTMLGKLDTASSDEKAGRMLNSKSTVPILTRSPYGFFTTTVRRFSRKLSKNVIPIAVVAIAVGGGLWYKASHPPVAPNSSDDIAMQMKAADPIKLIDDVSAGISSESASESQNVADDAGQADYLASSDTINDHDYNDDQL